MAYIDVSAATITCGAEYTTYYDHLAFDGNGSTRWASDVTPNWLKVDLGAGNEQASGGIVYTAESPPNAFTFEGSNDNSSWTTLLNTNGANSVAEQTFTYASNLAYRYYRMSMASNFNDWLSLWTLNIVIPPVADPANFLCSRGRDRMRSKGISLGVKVSVDGNPSFLTMRRNRLRTTGVSLEDADSYNYVWPCRIPDMTSDTAPAGTCSSSVETAWNAYDRNDATFVQKTSTLWVQYRFPMLVKANQLEFITHVAANNDIKDWKLECSTDGATWTVAASGQKADADKTLQTITSFNAHPGSDYWRFTIINSWQVWHTVLTIQITGNTRDIAYDDFGY